MAAIATPSMRSRFQANWVPVRVKKTRQNKKLEPGSDSIGIDQAPRQNFEVKQQ
jgi:hypothetical protein